MNGFEFRAAFQPIAKVNAKHKDRNDEAQDKQDRFGTNVRSQPKSFRFNRESENQEDRAADKHPEQRLLLVLYEGPKEHL